jgi:hypothetical protein
MVRTYIPDKFEPHALDVWNMRLPTELSLTADLKCDTGDFRCEGTQPHDHSVDSVLEIQYFSPRVDFDLL